MVLSVASLCESGKAERRVHSDLMVQGSLQGKAAEPSAWFMVHGS